VVVVLDVLVVGKSSITAVLDVVEVVVVSDEGVVVGVVVVTSSAEPAASTSEVDVDEFVTIAGVSSPLDAVADQMNPPRNATMPATAAAIAVLRPFTSPLGR
jgi:hypothetical protein